MGRFEDKILHCIDCGEDFTFTVGEQRFYFSKSLSEPKRCPACRQKRKALLVPDTGRKDKDERL